MKISIITVVYNNEATISEAIQSVLAQKNIQLEYIVIDGGSTDNTLKVINNYKDRINCLISEADEGLYDAMNKGIRSATGDIIGILNSDDIYTDCYVISDVVEQFELDPKLDILYGNLLYVKVDNTSQIVRRWNSKPYYNQFFEDGNVAPHPTVFLKKKVYEEAGLFDLSYNLAADYEFLLRTFKMYSYRTKYFDRVMVKMRLGGATNKSYRNIFYGNREILRAWSKHGLKVPIRLMP
ncbi:MAG: glycosyl transferase family 2, partial [Daejeonella sp.]|nr:glycosyl transferase family 2 [Daejeonella sp.]